MTTTTSRGRAWLSTIAFLCVVALIVVAALAFAMTRPSATKYSAMMTNAIGLYPGNDVRVLGVPVGRITGITPQGQLVRVDFEVNRNVKVPADAKAVIVVPTVVADRFLQLAPPYNGGPTMPPDAVIPPDRTAVPAEFDDLLAAVQKLSTSLGPQGLNANGALSEALHTAAQNFAGNGDRFNTALSNTAQAITTLSASRENLAGTVNNLQSFTTNLKQNDAQVREFTRQFAEVSGFLADEREDLGEALKELSIALGDLAKFIHDNRHELRVNVDRLADILATVNSERLALEQALDMAQSGLDNLVNSYDASAGTLDTRSDLLAALLCGLYTALSPLLPPDLLQILTNGLNLIIPGGLAGCANVGGGALPLQLPSEAKAALSDPKVLNALLSAIQRKQPSSSPLPNPLTPQASQQPAQASGESANKPESDQQSMDRPEPGLPSLGSLFGGGQ